MSRRILRQCLLVVLGLLVTTNVASAAVGVGDQPKFDFLSTDGQRINQDTFKGKLVLVDFWATWCGPCMDEAGHMVAVHKQYKDQGLQLIGISLDQDKAALDTVVKQLGFEWPQFYDGNGWRNRIASQWGVDSIPRTFLLGPDGTVLWTGHPARMDKPIELALQQAPPVTLPAEQMSAAEQIIGEGEAAIASGNTSAAMQALANLPPEARRHPGIDARAKLVEQQLAPRAETLLAGAEALVAQKQFGQAAQQLKVLSTMMADTESGRQASQRLTRLRTLPEARPQIERMEKEEKATAELNEAIKLEGAGDRDDAYLKLRQITSDYADTPAAAAAREKLKGYDQDQTFAKQAMETAAAGKAKSLLGLAQSYAAADRKDLARQKLNEIITQFPGTSFAEQAKKELAKLGE